MSTDVADQRAARQQLAEWDRLELAVRRLLDENRGWRRRVRDAERRIAELEAALERVRNGPVDPLSLTARVDAAENENRILRNRLDQARESVRRIRARLEFLREAP